MLNEFNLFCKTGQSGDDGETGAIGPIGPTGSQGTVGRPGLKGFRGEDIVGSEEKTPYCTRFVGRRLCSTKISKNSNNIISRTGI